MGCGQRRGSPAVRPSTALAPPPSNRWTGAMLPMQVSVAALAELADTLDAIAASLRGSAATTAEDFDAVDLPGRGFVATSATDRSVDQALRTVGSIEAAVAATSAAVRRASTAYADADRRSLRSW
jgi:hypothetical protein